MAPTTGTLISGKTSVGMREIVTAPSTNIRRAETTKVYGRRSASRTIHIAEREVLLYRASPAVPRAQAGDLLGRKASPFADGKALDANCPDGRPDQFQHPAAHRLDHAAHLTVAAFHDRNL